MAKIPGIDFTLLDGTCYTAGLITMGQLERYQKSGIAEKFSEQTFKDVLMECIHKNHPDVTWETISENMTPKSIMKLFNDLLTESGINTSGKAQAGI